MRQLIDLGMMVEDRTRAPVDLMLAVRHLTIAECRFRLSFNRDMVLRMKGLVGVGAFDLAADGSIHVPHQLPETILTASVGKQIAELIHHPVLAASPLVVKHAYGHGGGSSFELDSETCVLGRA